MISDTLHGQEQQQKLHRVRAGQRSERARRLTPSSVDGTVPDELQSDAADRLDALFDDGSVRAGNEGDK